MTSRNWSLVNFILPKEAEVGKERCCTRPWSENPVCKAMVAQGGAWLWLCFTWPPGQKPAPKAKPEGCAKHITTLSTD